MSDQQHRGARPPGPLSQPPDRRVLELDEAVRDIEARGGSLPALAFFRDATRAAQSRHNDLSNGGTFARGTVIHSLPYVNWYKVQTADGGCVSACMGSGGTMMPLGTRDVAMAGPNDDVLLFRQKGLNYYMIVCVLPPMQASGKVACPDWTVQGGNSGIKREEGHKYPVKSLYKSGGVHDWSAQRPTDQTPLDRGWITSSGLAITIEDALIQVRVNEMAGLWMTLVDGWVRLAGQQLLVESPTHELDAGDDEGEARYFRGIATYLHEALGQYASGQTFTQENDDKEVQYTSPKGKVDVKDGDEKTVPIYRYKEFGGYLGQGHLRTVMKPAKTSGSQKLGETEPDYGLFMESIGLDGSYSVQFAKSGYIGKRVKIAVPKPKNLHTAKAGDDKERGGYKFASLYGSGPEHKVGDVPVSGSPRSMVRVAAVADLNAYDLNWKAIHPFHYHDGDYTLPQQSELSKFGGNQEAADFSGFFVPDPEPKTLDIDPRYGEVEYFERECFIRWHDDGTLHLGGGAGEEIVLGGGRIRMTAPLGIDACPGTDFTVQGDQFVVRTKGSIDLSSSEKDVRIKAEVNLHLLGGNAKTGGVMVESKGEGRSQRYKNKFGEDIDGRGIILKSANGVIGLLSKDIYLRTGGPLGDGDILLDAAQGNAKVQVFGKNFDVFSQKAVAFYYGPLEKTSEVRQAYYFGDKTAIFDVRLHLGGKLIGYSGGGGSAGIVVDGSVNAAKGIAAGGRMADSKGGQIGKVSPGFVSTITTATSKAAKGAEEAKKAGTETHKNDVVQKYYQPNQLGDAEVLEQIAFGFRDPPGSPTQYHTEKFKWPESRWQQWVRFGLGSGGVAWTERPVIYQGRDTYPWPGKRKLTEEPTFLKLSQSTMFDAAAGQDKDRPGPYESPEIGTFEPSTLDGEYTLNR